MAFPVEKLKKLKKSVFYKPPEEEEKHSDILVAVECDPDNRDLICEIIRSRELPDLKTMKPSIIREL